MTRREPLFVGGFTAALVISAALAGCSDRGAAGACPAPTEFYDLDMKYAGFEGVDILVVVDNSISMAQEQEILATSMHSLVNALVDPIPGWDYPPQDDVRVAVVTSDMGLGFEDACDPDQCPWMGERCTDLGDDGLFQENVSNERVPSIRVAQGEIPCDQSASQCPPGWVCEDVDPETFTGVCADPEGTGVVPCPSPGSDHVAESGEDHLEQGFATEVACLTEQGTGGCGIEQQLMAAQRGLTREDQLEFVRPEALLVVMVVSDEEDCSVADPALFFTDEFADGPSQVNLACGNHPEHLHPASHFFTAFTNVKDTSNATVFVGIVGVPPGDICEGPGDKLGACLEHDDMQLEEILEVNSAGQQVYNFAPACTREAGGEVVTRATPGRRYVELANEEFGRTSYIYSICNEDWSPAMDEISTLLSGQIGRACFPVPLPWNAATEVAGCRLMAEFENATVCPPQFGDPHPEISTWEDSWGVVHESALCEVPKISTPLFCEDFDENKIDEKVGWYYCEKHGYEDSAQACDDGIDNDADGDVDCDDADCAQCLFCGGTQRCVGTCVFNVRLTHPVRILTQGRSLWVRCPASSGGGNPDCREDSAATCADGIDNDLDGAVDCDNVFYSESLDRREVADPDCCPLEKDPENGRCVNLDTTICGGMSDACVIAAQVEGCIL